MRMPLDRNFRAAVYDVNNRVCWGPPQTRKDTRKTLRPLYPGTGTRHPNTIEFSMGSSPRSARMSPHPRKIKEIHKVLSENQTAVASNICNYFTLQRKNTAPTNL